MTTTSRSEGRVALVTGAGQGVGRQTALELVTRGVATSVIVNDFVADKAEAVADEVRALGGRAVAAPFDVCDVEAVRESMMRATSELGGVDVLVNNAGGSGTAGVSEDQAVFWESDPSQWQPWLGINLTGVLNCTHAVLAGMVERSYGRIVTVVSDAGRIGRAQSGRLLSSEGRRSRIHARDRSCGRASRGDRKLCVAGSHQDASNGRHR